MNKSTPLQPVRLTDRSTLNSTIEVLEQHFDLSAGYSAKVSGASNW
jgi:hypothetical protein